MLTVRVSHHYIMHTPPIEAEINIRHKISLECVQNIIQLSVQFLLRRNCKICQELQRHIHEEDGTINRQVAWASKNKVSREFGHIAIKCSKPSRRAKCEKCKKVGHDSKDYKVQRNVTKVENIDDTTIAPEIVKPLFICAKRYHYSSGKTLRRVGGVMVQSTEAARPTINFEGREFSVQLNIVHDNVILHELLIGRDIQVLLENSLGQGMFVVQSIHHETSTLLEDESIPLMGKQKSQRLRSRNYCQGNSMIRVVHYYKSLKEDLLRTFPK